MPHSQRPRPHLNDVARIPRIHQYGNVTLLRVTEAKPRMPMSVTGLSITHEAVRALARSEDIEVLKILTDTSDWQHRVPSRRYQLESDTDQPNGSEGAAQRFVPNRRSTF